MTVVARPAWTRYRTQATKMTGSEKMSVLDTASWLAKTNATQAINQMPMICL
jgi:hypothetical protein